MQRTTVTASTLANQDRGSAKDMHTCPISSQTAFNTTASGLASDWKGRLERQTGKADWKGRLERQTGKADWKGRMRGGGGG